MTWHCQKQTSRFGEYTAVDLVGLPAGQAKMAISYSHATQFAFEVIAAEHTAPIERLAFVRIWSSEGTLADGTTAQSETAPLFEGFVESVSPGGDSNKVRIVCFDPTMRANKEVKVMSRPWVAGDPTADPLEWPTDGVGAVPYVVYNAPDSHQDYAICVGFEGSVGNIIAGLLEYQQEALFWRNASPANGLDPNVSDLAYVWTDELEQLDFVPQEAITWESEPIRAAVERVQRWEPRFRMLWEPGARLWRYTNITTAPQVTVRLNDPTVDHPVLSLNLTPSFDRCFTALKIYGPYQSELEEFIWYHEDVAPEGWTNSLQPIDPSVLLETYSDAGGSHEARTWREWQIVDTAKRAGARTLPDWSVGLVGAPGLDTVDYQINAKTPLLMLSWNAGVEWFATQAVWFDFFNGKAIFKGTSPYAHRADSRGQSIESGSTQTYYPPNAVKLVWAPFTEPLTVRVPETGFEGSAYEVAGLELEERLYDPSLAIGVEFGVPVTTEARTEQFVKLAQSHLDKHKDICWVGGFVLDGIDWTWQRLAKRVNFEASDGSGGTVTTGWDIINAFVTDVEYDFAESLTTVTFSSDRAENIGEDVAQMKERLKIRALEQRIFATQENQFRTEFNYRGEKMNVWSGMTETFGFEYVDAKTGTVVEVT